MGILWIIGKVLSQVDVVIDVGAALYMTVAVAVIGHIYGMGYAYGARPHDKQGVTNIWLFALIVASAAAGAIAQWGMDYMPEIKTKFDFFLIAALGFLRCPARQCGPRHAQRKNQAG